MLLPFIDGIFSQLFQFLNTPGKLLVKTANSYAWQAILGLFFSNILGMKITIDGFFFD